MMTTLIVMLPLMGFAANGLIHLASLPQKQKQAGILAGILGSAAMLISFGLALAQFFKLRALGPEHAVLETTLFSWIRLGGLAVDFGYRLDSLSIVFTLVITGVGSLIHLYSIGYMHGDGVAKYFSYLNFFCFMMLNLVLGTSLPHVFLGWEGVGLASYLLIGFWFQDFGNVRAAQKAFVMNRIGDLGFLIAMFIAFKAGGTLDLIQLGTVPMSEKAVTTLGLLIFFACTGKSAQIPLFTWLPDAMAGPTPVSALIHAATMVTSGIYLLSRLHPVIAASPLVLEVIMVVGAATALMAAIMACLQTDIKKVLAYSTVSQLGFMFVACGVGSFESGLFHVMTHAFFKALLFLGAGSVIHALSGGQNIFKMGGLRRELPVTFWTFTFGWAAILGLPPLSGFFSKDEIIFESLASPHGSPIVFGVLLLSALLTAFYMTRLYVLVFFGKHRMTEKEKSHLHESPWIMTVPLVVLAGASLAGGWFGPPVHFGHSEAAASGVSSSLIMGVSVLVALVGASLAFSRYFKKVQDEKTIDPFQIDRMYASFFGRGTERLSRGFDRYLEGGVIQRMIQVSGAMVDLSGNLIRVFQTGSAQTYLVMIVFAILGLVSWLIFGVGTYGKF